MAVHIGTSGFLYDHWRGRFYPPSARGSELEAYAADFDTVELNVTFYRLPSAATFRSWAGRVPDGFVFAVKASRYLTHIRRLREPREAVGRLMDRAFELGPHLGPVLLQLPPDMTIDADRLAGVLDSFPSSVRVAFEPRNGSWYTHDTRAVLEDHEVALCLADRRGPQMPDWRTADWGYLRFHEGRGRPASCYGTAALSTWAERITRLWPADAEVFAYFNNDHAGCALRDAAVLARRLDQRGATVSRLPAISADVVSPVRRPRPRRPRAGR